jgi:hypothetical protein
MALVTNSVSAMFSKSPQPVTGTILIADDQVPNRELFDLAGLPLLIRQSVGTPEKHRDRREPLGYRTST